MIGCDSIGIESPYGSMCRLGDDLYMDDLLIGRMVGNTVYDPNIPLSEWGGSPIGRLERGPDGFTYFHAFDPTYLSGLAISRLRQLEPFPHLDPFPL